MSSVEFATTSKRALKALIEREAIRTGSRTVAYEIVAQTIGTSSSWIRKFLSYDGVVKEPRYALFQNIASYYDNICTRVENEQNSERRKLAQLRVEIDALTQSFNRMDGNTQAAQSRPTPSATVDEGE